MPQLNYWERAVNIPPRYEFHFFGQIFVEVGTEDLLFAN